MRKFMSLVLLGMSTIAESADTEELARQEFAAFTIDLPKGNITKQGQHPGTGSMTMMLSSPESLKGLGPDLDRAQLLPPAARQIQVQWTPYAIASDEDRKVLIDTVLGALPIPNVRVFEDKVISDQRRLYVLGGDEFPMAVGVIACGPDFGVAITMAFTRDQKALSAAGERIVKSVFCKPESAKPQRHEAAVRLPKTFGRSMQEGVELFMSTEGEMLMVGFIPQDMQRHEDVYNQVMSAMLSSVLGVPRDKLTIKVVGSAGGASDPAARTQTAVLSSQGNDLDGAYIHVRYCSPQDLSLFSMWYAEEPTLDRARVRFGQVGCPGEPTEKVGDVAVVFGDACKAGEELACEMLKQIQAQTP